jgi:Mrp family chromosome partitioning ATPase
LRPDGIETLKGVARRSAWLVVLSVAVGAVAMNLIRTTQGPLYAATSKVVLSPTDLSQALTGFSSYVDPQVVDATEQALASSRQLFERVAADSDNRVGTANEIDGATRVSKSGGTVTFSVTSESSGKAVEIADAVARTYPTWRADVQGAAITQAIDQVEARLKESKQPDPSLQDQLNRLRVLKTLTSGNVLLVEPADGAAKTRPRPFRDSLVGGLIGLFVALLVVAARELIETRVRSEAEVEELLSAPVIGTVEALPRRLTVAAGHRGERYQDMYGLLAANLAQLEHKPRGSVIAVTSATAEEGKTTTASNIGAALARRGADVVLIDLDTRKPSLSKVFNIPAGALGIDDVLANRTPAEEAMWTISPNGYGMVATQAAPRTRDRAAAARTNGRDSGSLRVLPMGPSSGDDVVRHSKRLEGVLKDLAVRADYVLVDTPPALSVPNMTEIAQLVDLVLVVVRHGRVSRRSLSALTRLQRSWPDVSLAAVLVGTPRYEEVHAYYGSQP